MQIRQIINEQETRVVGNLSTATVEKGREIENQCGFQVPVQGSSDFETGMSFVAQKAKSMTEQHTSNNAEYIAGVMNNDIYEKAESEGVDLSKEEEEGIVTVVDKIQLQMVQGGNEAVMATADLSKEDLEKISTKATTAYEMAQKLVTPDKEEISYLVENQLEPTVGNFYQAQNVTSSNNAFEKTEVVSDELKQQIKERLNDFGIEANEENLNRAIYMVSRGLSFTKESFTYFGKIEELQLPLSEEENRQAIADALSFGRDPVCAMVLPEYTWQNRAINSNEVIKEATEDDLAYLVSEGLEVTIENLEMAKNSDKVSLKKEELTIELKLTKARKSLEEVRLHMTVQANLTLIKKGVHLETENIENLIEELKEQESKLTNLILGDTEEQKKVTDTLGEVKQAPAYLMYQVEMSFSLTQVHELSINQTEETKADYVKANGAYETMQTEVRRDLGDSIQKAFRNIDDILEDMNMEISESNRRAVRILAYNQTEITQENISIMKEKDEKMQTIFQKMTPKAVLSMIRDGYNPLDVSLDELRDKLQAIEEKMDPEGVDKYSKFLVQLEQQNAITKEERDAFIGVYRLLRQVEKSDGAAIGAVILSGGEVTMRNLMTQVRTAKTGKIDITVDDTVGQLEKDMVADLSITQQIEASYQATCVGNALDEITPEKLQNIVKNNNLEQMTPEQFLEALRYEEEVVLRQEEQQNMVKEAFKLVQNNEELNQFFNQFEVPKTAENILAVAEFMKDRSGLFKNLYKKHTTLDVIKDIKEDIWEKFSEQVKTPEDMAKAQQTLAEVAEHVMEGMMESDDVTSLDLKEMKLMSQQISILGSMAKKEEYAVPVLVQDEMGCVSLKIVRGKEEKGKVNITFETQTLGKIAAEFSVTKNGMKGYVVADNENTKSILEEDKEKLRTDFESALGDQNVDCVYATSKNLSLEKFYSNSGISESEGKSEIQTRQLYSIARVFIKSISDLKM